MSILKVVNDILIFSKEEKGVRWGIRQSAIHSIQFLNANINKILKEISLELNLPENKQLSFNCLSVERRTTNNKDVYDAYIFLGGEEISHLVFYTFYYADYYDKALECVLHRLLECKEQIAAAINSDKEGY